LTDDERESGSDTRERRGRGRERPGGRWRRRIRQCQFCVDKSSRIDYKDAETLRRFLSDRGKIRPRRQTGTCARHQRQLAQAIKRARHLALLAFTAYHSRTG